MTVHFLEDLERILKSDPARPPLAPLSTSDPCLACEAWAVLTEFRQPIQVQSHLEMPGILVQLGHIQHI